MFDRFSHEAAGVPRLEGEPSREEQLAIYEAAVGRTVGPTRIYEIFAAIRYAVIMALVTNRMVRASRLPENHTFWRDNAAVTVLDQLFGE